MRGVCPLLHLVFSHPKHDIFDTVVCEFSASQCGRDLYHLVDYAVDGGDNGLFDVWVEIANFSQNWHGIYDCMCYYTGIEDVFDKLGAGKWG